MATLRQLRTRVSSIRSIERVTHAMRMVAVAKMRRAQGAVLAARPYAEQLERVLRHLVGSVESGTHPLLADRAEVRSIALVLVTADRGLCGGFNGNTCRRALGAMREHRDLEVELVAVGRKGADFLRARGQSLSAHHVGLFKSLQFQQAAAIAQRLTDRYVGGQVDRVLLVHSEFRSVARQVPAVRQLLPVVPAEDDGAVAGEDYIFEPEPGRLLEALAPRYVSFQVWRALLETHAGEQAARMQAMDSATKNAGNLIEQLTRQMNKERQAAITLELMDIVGGAEAVS